MWLWLFLAIALAGLIWHGILLFSVASKAKRVVLEAQPATTLLAGISERLGQPVELAKPELAIETPLEDLMVRRMLLLRRRATRKAARERRLLERLQQIDPTERRFTRDKRT